MAWRGRARQGEARQAIKILSSILGSLLNGGKIMLLIFFVFGFCVDALIAQYTRKIISRKGLQAGALAAIITAINLWVYGLIITQDLMLSAGLAFSLGCGVGTWAVTRYGA
jgi:hypothetical protein